MPVQELKKRSEQPIQYQWRLEDIFASNEAWEKEFTETEAAIAGLARYAGTLAQSPAAFWEAMEAMQETELRVERLFAYARMRKDEDNSVSLYQGMADRAMALTVRLESETAFTAPELVAMGDETWQSFLAQDARLGKYARFMEKIAHQRAHTLDAAGERLLAMSGEMAAGADNVYTMLTSVDMKPATIQVPGEGAVEVTRGRLVPLLQSRDRGVRQAAFQAFYAAYADMGNTLAATMTASIRGDIFYARARGFGSALEASLFDDAVPVGVYDALIEAVHGALPSMYRYMALRKRALKVEELHMYDVYCPIVEDVDMPIDYPAACDLVARGLAPMGQDYIDTLKKGLADRWVDVYENAGKSSGAYSWGVWGGHPYVLMNWSDDIDHAFTLAHEMGHSMHSYYSDANLPYVDAGYPLLLAEVASTSNEALLMQYMLDHTRDPKERMYLINHYLEEFRGTVFRQVMFAEFEKITHHRVEAGEALTVEDYKDIYRELNRLYYGPDMVVDEEIAMEWARIPHFYRAFYVYKYATGFASAIALAQMVLREGEAGQKKMLAFLSSGGSDFPLQLLRKAGVDLEKPETVADALSLFDSLVTELENLMEV